MDLHIIEKNMQLLWPEGKQTYGREFHSQATHFSKLKGLTVSVYFLAFSTLPKQLISYKASAYHSSVSWRWDGSSQIRISSVREGSTTCQTVLKVRLLALCPFSLISCSGGDLLIRSYRSHGDLPWYSQMNVLCLIKSYVNQESLSKRACQCTQNFYGMHEIK